jgi:hypothetical protein
MTALIPVRTLLGAIGLEVPLACGPLSDTQLNQSGW